MLSIDLSAKGATLQWLIGEGQTDILHSLASNQHSPYKHRVKLGKELLVEP